MKKTIILFLLLLLPISSFAQSFLISNIPIPKTYIQNLDPYPCDDKCLQEYLDRDMIFSFLSNANNKLQNKELDEIRMMHISIFNLGSNIFHSKVKIALLLPYKKIGKYAASTTNASMAYLISKNNSFNLRSYKIEDESIQEIEKALILMKKDGFSHIIAPLTKKGVDNITIINPSINIFFPTINKKDTNTTSNQLFFGGIDYQAQSDELLKEAVSPLVIFYDKSSLGKKLALYEENKFKDIDINNTVDTNNTIVNTNKTVIKFSIPRRTTNLEKYLKDNKDINASSCFINTPIVKTGMIMSQLTLYDTNTTEITNILSTQINYDPLLLSMTQYTDRKNMIIANSITQEKNILIQTNALLGNDIVYNWINYTTTVGIDYFYHILTSHEREYKIELEDNQMQYEIELIKPSFSKFKPYIKKRI